MSKSIRPIERVNPDPRLTGLMDFALEHVSKRLAIDSDFAEYDTWQKWAAAWQAGQRSPAACVDVAHIYLAKRESNPIAGSLGQLCWAGKEACYSTPESGWRVIRYVADAMIAFGVAFPNEALLGLPPPPQGDGLDLAHRYLSANSMTDLAERDRVQTAVIEDVWTQLASR